MNADGIRFYADCGHSTRDHAPDLLCVRRVEYARLERERIDKYGPCPSCEYSLPMGCNHPVEVPAHG